MKMSTRKYFSIEQRQFIVEHYLKCQKWEDVKWAFQRKYHIIAPTIPGMIKMLKKFRARGTVHNQHKGNEQLILDLL